MINNKIAKPIRWQDYITININWFAITTRSQVLSPLIIPLLVQQFVGDSQKGSYLGIMRLGALMFAVLTQSLVGMISDQSKSKWGRRRPFVFFGAIFESIIIVFIGFTMGMEGMRGYWILFILFILSMVGSNISHAATQGFIPDLVPDEKKGIFSGIKATLELPLPLIFISFFLGKLVAEGNLSIALSSLIIILLLGMAITMMVPEKVFVGPKAKLNLQPFFRLLGMTAIFTIVIIFSGLFVNYFISFGSGLKELNKTILVGLVGLIGMVIAVALGVLLSIRVALGTEVKENKAYVWWVVNRLAFLVAATNLAGFLIFFLQEKFPEFQGLQAAGPASKIIMFVGIFILISALPSGFLADRIGKKTLIAISGIAVGLGSLLVVFAPNLNLIYLAGCIIGTGVGLFYTSNWALGTEIVPKDEAGKYLGISNLAGAGAGAIGAYIGGPIADSNSYVLLMGIYGIMAFLSIFAIKGIKK